MGKIIGLTFPTDTDKIEFTAPAEEETVQQTEVPDEEIPNEEATNKKGGKK